jgi:transcriptional regulator with XRE-family HTH domain
MTTEQLVNLIDAYGRQEGLSQRAIAKSIGIDKASLSRFLSGKRGLTKKSLDKVIAYNEGIPAACALASPRGNRESSKTSATFTSPGFRS